VDSIPNKAIKQENLQLAVFTAFNILASYKFPLIEALCVIATSFLLLKVFAKLSRPFVFPQNVFGMFRQALRQSRQYSLRALPKNKMSLRIGFSLFGAVAQNLAVVFIKWRMLY